jgi:hypothetical protein
MNKQLILKLMALEAGGTGESKNASLQLEKLLKKHNVTRDFFKSEQRTVRRFSYKGKYEHDLLVAVLYWVLGMLGDEIKPFGRRGQKGVFCELNDFEFARAKHAYSTWIKALNDELEVTFLAFLAKNRIFSPLPTNCDSKTDLEKILKVQRRSEQMQRVQVDKALSQAVSK